MTDFIIEIIVGVIVTIVVAQLGIGVIKTKVVHTHEVKIKKTGKWIILISVAMIFFGLVAISNNHNPEAGFENENLKFWIGFAFLGYGIVLFIIGKIVAWFQRL